MSRAGGAPDAFPSDASGLPEAGSPAVVELVDGDALELRIAPVAKRLGDRTVRMLAYNGSIPGPTLKVPQGSEAIVTVVNDGDLESTVHWHGLRLDWRSDGTHETQEPIPVGGGFTCRVTFPDPGVYWYHPHIREDYGQELGLYGNILVVPSDPDYWPPVDRELLLTLDDVLLEGDRVAPFSRSETTFTAMGRFGDVMLVGGETDLSLAARPGEVVRLYLTNTANTRVFNLALPGARMKLVGGDSGRCEREEIVESVVLAPSERAVVDVLFEAPGELALEHRTPDRTYRLAGITVGGGALRSSHRERFWTLRTDPELVAERERLVPVLSAEPDKTLSFVAEMDMGEPASGDALYVCPMHPEVVRGEPGRCPECGMRLVPAALVAEATTGADHGGHSAPGTAAREADDHTAHHAAEHGHHAHPARDAPAHEPHAGGHSHEAGRGIEWEDDMVEVNRMTTPATMRWMLVDRDTGARNAEIDWRFRVGDRVKIRLVNEMDSDHPMHHPFHIHGAGRFLVLTRDGAVEPNLVWSDTVLVRTGATVDILLEVTNPGIWMAHCHIAEHHEGGMMLGFTVDPPAS
ncbi:multicopper oxidase family protein [Miltoncostaea marina]|uniref:multicopper oxidase family protein n=1 Tax=Miltoncostaea marina TaxID=2843215 RepID=UPI001C3D727F|nr:multicopper oxidase family protein [Miltoncostaea marina]